MAKYDRISAFLWICIALTICVESLRLGPGSFMNPGPGFVPLASGLILWIFAGIVLILSFKKGGEVQEVLWKPGMRWRKMISIVLSIIAYALLIHPLGFHLITFTWMGFVCWRIGGMKLRSAIIISLITTLSVYLIFEHYLNILFPKGFLGF
jgi:putative tricarboxylic transport membrane protein